MFTEKDYIGRHFFCRNPESDKMEKSFKSHLDFKLFLDKTMELSFDFMGQTLPPSSSHFRILLKSAEGHCAKITDKKKENFAGWFCCKIENIQKFCSMEFSLKEDPIGNSESDADYNPYHLLVIPKPQPEYRHFDDPMIVAAILHSIFNAKGRFLHKNKQLYS